MRATALNRAYAVLMHTGLANLRSRNRVIPSITNKSLPIHTVAQSSLTHVNGRVVLLLKIIQIQRLSSQNDTILNDVLSYLYS